MALLGPSVRSRKERREEKRESERKDEEENSGAVYLYDFQIWVLFSIYMDTLSERRENFASIHRAIYLCLSIYSSCAFCVANLLEGTWASLLSLERSEERVFQERKKDSAKEERKRRC